MKSILAALGLVVVVLVALTVHGLREQSSPETRTTERSARAPVTSVAEVAPWQAAAPPEAMLPGTVPVSQIDPPRPDPTVPMPPAVVEPPNPALHRPPMDNPGGVDGDRPARAVPALD